MNERRVHLKKQECEDEGMRRACASTEFGLGGRSKVRNPPDFSDRPGLQTLCARGLCAREFQSRPGQTQTFSPPTHTHLSLSPPPPQHNTHQQWHSVNEAELPEDEEEDEVVSEEVTEEVEEEDEGEDEEASLTEVRLFFLCLLPFLSSRSHPASGVGNTVLVLCWLLEVGWLQMFRSLDICWPGPLRKVWQGGKDRCSTLFLFLRFPSTPSLADPLSF